MKSSPSLACKWVPHCTADRGTLEHVIASASGTSETFVRRSLDPENSMNFDELARAIEECRIVMIDERCGTIQAFGAPANRARRQMVLSMLGDDDFQKVVLPPLAHRALMKWADGTKKSLTNCCVVVYLYFFFAGFAIGTYCVVYGLSFA